MPRFAWPWPRRKPQDTDESELGLRRILKLVTDEIIARQQDIKAGSERGVFFIEKAKVSISFVVRKSGTGGVKLYVVDAEGAYASERIQRVDLDLVTTPPLLSALLSSLTITNQRINEEINRRIDELLSSEREIEVFFEAFRQQAGE
jgi:hypothetical protein